MAAVPELAANAEKNNNTKLLANNFMVDTKILIYSKKYVIHNQNLGD